MSPFEKRKLVDIVITHHCEGAHHLQYILDQILREFLSEGEYKDFLKEFSEDGIYSGWEEGIAP